MNHKQLLIKHFTEEISTYADKIKKLENQLAFFKKKKATSEEYLAKTKEI